MWNNFDIKVLAQCALARLFYDMANAEIYRNNPEQNFEELEKLIKPKITKLLYSIWNENGEPFEVLNRYIDKIDQIINSVKHEVQKVKEKS
nr:MAG TPA: hypothetical protein [Bacteriophage sp.]